MLIKVGVVIVRVGAHVRGHLSRERFPTYVITIHQRHRRMDRQTRQTTCNHKTALCTKAHCAVKTRHCKYLEHEHA